MRYEDDERIATLARIVLDLLGRVVSFEERIKELKCEVRK
jgi:hypothetical protein